MRINKLNVLPLVLPMFARLQTRIWPPPRPSPSQCQSWSHFAVRCTKLYQCQPRAHTSQVIFSIELCPISRLSHCMPSTSSLSCLILPLFPLTHLLPITLCTCLRVNKQMHTLELTLFVSIM